MVERPFPEAVRPSVVAVLVTHDPGTWFDGTLAALAAQDHPVLHVLVIDAGSTIDPTERVKAALPHASVVRIGASPGFGAAANQGFRAVDSEFAMLVNPDARIIAGTLAGFLKVARDHPRAGAMGALVRDPDGSIYPSARKIPSFTEGIVHTAVGKAQMTETQLRENILMLLQTIMRLKPATAKGQYLRGVAVSTTMGPGIRLDVNEAVRLSTEAH